MYQKKKYQFPKKCPLKDFGWLELIKGRYMYNIGNVGKTSSVSMLTLFESRYIYWREGQRDIFGVTHYNMLPLQDPLGTKLVGKLGMG